MMVSAARTAAILAVIASAAADESVIVNDADAQVQWVQSMPTNQTCETQDLGAPCDNAWWTGHQLSHLNGDAHFTFGPDTSLNFTFRGCSVGVFGVQLSWSGRGIASIDGGEEAVFDTRSPNEENHFRVPFYTTSGLDPMKTHTLTVKYDPSQFQDDPQSRVVLGIDYVTYAFPDYTTNSPTPGMRYPTWKPPSGSIRPGIGPCIGGVLGGILGVTAAVAIFLFWRRRRSKSHPEQLRTADRYGAPRPWRGSMLPTSRAPGAAPEPAVSPHRMEKKTEPPPYTAQG